MSRRHAPHTVLAGMDPATAARTTTDADLGARARADLDAVLATPTQSTTPADGQLAPPRRRHRARRHLAVGLVAAAAVVGIGVATPVVTQPAYAGWVATPAGVDQPGTQEAGEQCREFWAQSIPAQDPSADDWAIRSAADLHTALSERRGRFTFTVMRGPRGEFADCLLESSWFWDGPSGGGGISRAPSTPAPAAGAIDTASTGASGTGRMTFFGIPLPRDSRARSYAYGRAGADVTSVVLHTSAQGDVRASMAEGLWAAWWPSPESDPEVGGTTATLTLRDGTTRQVSLDDLQIPPPDTLG